jgi:hypothetical protein
MKHKKFLKKALRPVLMPALNYSFIIQMLKNETGRCYSSTKDNQIYRKFIPSSTKLSLPVANTLRPARFAFGADLTEGHFSQY